MKAPTPVTAEMELSKNIHDRRGRQTYLIHYLWGKTIHSGYISAPLITKSPVFISLLSVATAMNIHESSQYSVYE
jgi:hypothetical protein